MDSGLRVLAVFLALLAILAAAANGAGYDLETSGSGIGSGYFPASGDDLDLEQLPCRPPSVRPAPPPSREEPLLTEIRCHVACLQRVRSLVR